MNIKDRIKQDQHQDQNLVKARLCVVTHYKLLSMTAWETPYILKGTLLYIIRVHIHVYRNKNISKFKEKENDLTIKYVPILNCCYSCFGFWHHTHTFIEPNHFILSVLNLVLNTMEKFNIAVMMEKIKCTKCIWVTDLHTPTKSATLTSLLISLSIAHLLKPRQMQLTSSRKTHPSYAQMSRPAYK